MTQDFLASILKDLRILEVFEFYDSPILYSAVTRTGQIYLARMISTGQQSTNWYYVELSADKYRSLRNGRLTIRDAFLESENGFVIHCVVNADNKLTISVLEARTLSDKYLPEQDERLAYTDIWLPPLTTDTSQSAQSAARQVMDISLSIGENTKGVSADRVGSLLINVQAITEALASDQSKSLYRIPDYLKTRNRLYPTGVFAGSFGIRIVTSDETDFEFKDDEHALFRLIKLLEDSADLEKLSISFKKLNLLSRSRFIRFLRSLADHELSIKLEWANRRGFVATTSMQLPRIRANLAYLEQTTGSTSETMEVQGILEAVGVTKRTFEFQEKAGPYIRGKIDKALLANLISHEEYFRVPYPILAILKQEMKVHSVTGEETMDYTLMDFKLPEEGSEQ